MRGMFILVWLLSFIACHTVYAHQEMIWRGPEANAEHSGFVPIDINLENIKLAWRHRVSHDGFNKPQSLIVGRKQVFIYQNKPTQGSHVLSYQIEDGSPLWEHVLDNEQILYSILGHDKLFNLVQNAENHYLLQAINIDKGKPYYETELSRFVDFDNTGGLIIDKGVVYASLVGGLEVFAVKENEKRLYWRYHQEWYSPGLGLAPAATTTHIITVRADHMIANTKNNGNITDDLDLDNEYGTIVSNPMVVDRAHIYVRAELKRGQYFIYRFNLDTQKSTKLSEADSNPVSDGKYIYFLRANRLVALDTECDALIWQSFVNYDKASLSHLIVSNHLIFVSSAKGTFAISKEAPYERLWQSRQFGFMALTNTGLYLLNNGVSELSLARFSF